jgi:hypothetical protein
MPRRSISTPGCPIRRSETEHRREAPVPAEALWHGAETVRVCDAPTLGRVPFAVLAEGEQSNGDDRSTLVSESRVQAVDRRSRLRLRAYGRRSAAWRA